MPLTHCAIHGDSGSLEMCEHLKSDLDRGIHQEFSTLPIYTIRMCNACFEQHDVQSILDAVLLDREAVDALRAEQTGVSSIGPAYLFEAAALERDHPEVLATIVHLYNVLNERSSLMCEGCIDQVHVDHAQRMGNDAPFVIFEQTIHHSDDPRIDRLLALLRGRMNPRGNHGNAFYGCNLFAGTIRRPLTLRVYGISDPDEQVATLRVIEDFFMNDIEFQRSIEFFEPIRWTTTTDEDGTRQTRLPDVLLREVVVR